MPTNNNFSDLNLFTSPADLERIGPPPVQHPTQQPVNDKPVTMPPQLGRNKLVNNPQQHGRSHISYTENDEQPDLIRPLPPPLKENIVPTPPPPNYYPYTPPVKQPETSTGTVIVLPDKKEQVTFIFDVPKPFGKEGEITNIRLTLEAGQVEVSDDSISVIIPKSVKLDLPSLYKFKLDYSTTVHTVTYAGGKTTLGDFILLPFVITKNE